MYWATLISPVASGGLQYSPKAIGTFLALMGFSGGLLSFLLFPFIERKLGLVKTYRYCLACYAMLSALLPISNYTARTSGSGYTPVIYLWMGLLLFFNIFVTVSFGCSFNFIAAASPNSASYGILNGMAQSCVSILRAMGPFCATR